MLKFTIIQFLAEQFMHHAACYSYYLLYNKTRHLYIYIYIYVHIAGQTAGPIRLEFFVNTHGWLGGVMG